MKTWKKRRMVLSLCLTARRTQAIYQGNLLNWKPDLALLTSLSIYPFHPNSPHLFNFNVLKSTFLGLWPVSDLCHGCPGQRSRMVAFSNSSSGDQDLQYLTFESSRTFKILYSNLFPRNPRLARNGKRSKHE